MDLQRIRQFAERLTARPSAPRDTSIDRTPSFLAPEYVRDQQHQRMNLLTLGLFGAVIVATITAFWFTHGQWGSVKNARDQIASDHLAAELELAQLRELESRRAELMHRAEVVGSLLEGVPRSVAIAELMRPKPAGLAITRIEFNTQRIKPPPPPAEPLGPVPAPGATRDLGPGGVIGEAPRAKPQPPKFAYDIELVGIARSNDPIVDYFTGLRGSKLFESVELTEIEQRQVNRERWRQFAITLRLPPEANAADVAGVVENKLLGFTTASAMGE